MPRVLCLLFLILALSCALADTGVSVRDTGTLYFENVPETPKDVREQVRPYFNVRSASFAGWMADGGMLVRTRLGETTQVYRVREPGGRREQLTFFNEPVQWAESAAGGEHDQVVLLRDVGGDEDYQVFLMNPDSGQMQLLTDGESRHGGVVLSRDETRAAYFSTRRNGRDWDLYLANLESGEEREVFRGEGAWMPLDFSPGEGWLLMMQYVSTAESHPYLLDLESGEKRPLLETNGPVAFRDLAFVDGFILFISDYDREFLSIYRLPVEGGDPEIFVDAGWDVTQMAVSPDGAEVSYVVNEGGFGRLYRRDVASGRKLDLPELPDGVISQPRYSRDGQRLAFQLSAPDVSGDVYSISLGHGEVRRWTWSEVGGLDRARFVHPELIEYPTFDEVDGKSRRIPAWIYRPDGEGRHPVIVEIHGGPAAQRRPAFSTNVQYWVNELGAAVVVPNVRGSSGYGKTWLALDDKKRREDSVRDIGALLDWIGQQDDLDAERVLVYGGSYGGYMVLASLMHFGDRLAGGVNIVGISNFVTFLENTRDYRRDLRRAEYGDERDPEMRAFLEEISPANHPERLTRPLLVIQGLNDPRVPASEAEQVIAAMREAGQNPWYLLARNEGHGFRRLSNRIARAEAETLFLREVLDLGDHSR